MGKNEEIIIASANATSKDLVFVRRDNTSKVDISEVRISLAYMSEDTLLIGGTVLAHDNLSVSCFESFMSAEPLNLPADLLQSREMAYVVSDVPLANSGSRLAIAIPNIMKKEKVFGLSWLETSYALLTIAFNGQSPTEIKLYPKLSADVVHSMDFFKDFPSVTFQDFRFTNR